MSGYELIRRNELPHMRMGRVVRVRCEALADFAAGTQVTK